MRNNALTSWARRSPATVGVVLVAVGFIALFLAWNGAAGIDYVEGQLPYLLSGGLVGLGLIGAGLTVVNVQSRRQDSSDLASRLEELAEAVRKLEASAPPAPAEPARRSGGRLRADSRS